MFAFMGHWEIILIVLALLLLFGGRKIPELARGLGSGIREFQQGLKDKGDDPSSLPDKNSDSEDSGKKE
jgi:sec-independent protein translocase protein TatA